MVKVLISKQGNYPVKSTDIKRKLKAFFKDHGIVSDAEVSVAIVNENQMLALGRRYLGDNKLHNVLSFTPDETKRKFVLPPDGVIHLGEIIVCYPVAINEAKVENVLTAEKVYELIEHGAMHLLGFHHEE